MTVVCIAISLLTFLFFAPLFLFFEREKRQNQTFYSPLNRLSRASAMRLRALVGARVPART